MTISTTQVRSEHPPALDSSVRVPRTAHVDACPVCRALAARFFFRSPDRIWGTPGEFTYRRCRRCRTVFQDPRVVTEDLSLCYPDDYFTHEPAKEINEEPIPGGAGMRRFPQLREKIRSAILGAVRGARVPGLAGLLGRILARSRRLRERAFYDCVVDELIPSSPNRLRALDVGCGAGKMMLMLKRVGWEVVGVEWDPSAARIARSVSGLPVFEGDFRDVSPILGQYDLVVLHHVFEHLDDPAAALSSIKDLLAPGGKAVLMFPNSRSVGAYVFGSACCNWDPPRHLVMPGKFGLSRLASEHGLTTVRVRTSTRHAAWFFALSRSLRGSGPVDPGAVEMSAGDRLLAFLSFAMVVLGFQVGEEIFVTLERREGRALNPVQGTSTEVD